MDSRLASGEPIVIPFTNWASFEAAGSGSQLTTQFTVASQSLDAVFATQRDNAYDTQDSVVVSKTGAFQPADSQTTYYRFQSNDTGPQAGYSAGSGLPYTANTLQSQNYPGQARYQLLIDAKVYPQVSLWGPVSCTCHRSTGSF